MNDLELIQKIQQQASQCVKCGLCLPHCPTYNLTANECESPRGRIALIEGLSKNQLKPSHKLNTYLDHCLNCQACEAVCPANVPYGNLIDNARAYLSSSNNATRIPFFLDLITRYPNLARFANYLFRAYQVTGIQNFAKKTGLLKTLGLSHAENLLPPIIKPIHWKNYYPAINKQQGNVALFIGCISNITDQITLKAAIKLLTYCGFGVYLPSKQTCCGALHQHAGKLKQAAKFIKQNQIAFAKNKIDAIISPATGCTVMLQQHQFTARTVDINQFLTEISWPETIKIRPLQKTVVIHTPCTLRNILKAEAAPLHLLKKIPQLQIKMLSTQFCCGAAGLHMLNYPEIADNLVKNIISEIKQINALNIPPENHSTKKDTANNKIDYLITSNIGCALHISKNLKNLGICIKTAHPICLLAEQIEPM